MQKLVVCVIVLVCLSFEVWNETAALQSRSRWRELICGLQPPAHEHTLSHL